MARKLRPSSSTQLAALFSSLIGVAAVFSVYQLYNLGRGEDINSLFLKITLTLLLFICIGLFTVSHYVTKRLNLIYETARNIMHTGDISQRIPVDSRSDDLMRLSGVLNDMLEEIETLVMGIRTVTDNIAHDLRTPLTRLRNHIEQLHSPSPDTDERAHTARIEQLIEECDTLLGTFNALLRISNIESGKRHSAFEQMDIEILLVDILELYEPIAQEKRITLHYTGHSAHIFGDKDLLFQALANIIDNAIKYTPEDGKVHIRLGSVGTHTYLEIEDTGPGVTPEQRQQLFQRFYRTDASRNTPGNGLGLSLVKAIIELHKARISLDCGSLGGLLVRIAF